MKPNVVAEFYSFSDYNSKKNTVFGMPKGASRAVFDSD
jgi:hypothetical protein